MKKFSGSLSRRYGSALFNTFTELFKNNDKQFEEHVNALRALQSVFDKNFNLFLQNEFITEHEKVNLINELIKKVKPNIEQDKLEVLVNFFGLIIKNKRAVFLNFILKYFFNQCDKHLLITRVHVTSTAPLSQEELTEFSKASTKNNTVIFSNSVDESLKSGFIVTLGNKNIDASLKTILNQLKSEVL